MEATGPVKKPTIKLLESALKPKLIIPAEVSKKKDYLCALIPYKEWSGIIFYKVEGDLDKIETLVFTLVDLQPMDVGTAGATAYQFDGAGVVDLFADKPDLLECRMGHMHSHNTMGVFFSGTDTDELKDNAPNHNIYLSVIVNNAGHVTAKIAIASKLVSESKQTISFKGIAGKLFNIKTPETVEEDIILTFSMDIEEIKASPIDDDVFMKKVAEITAPKAAATVPANNWNKGQKDFQKKSSTTGPTGIYTPKSYETPSGGYDGLEDDAIDLVHSLIGVDTITNKPYPYLLRRNLEKAQEEIDKTDLTSKEILDMYMTDVVSIFDIYCDGYWADTIKDNATIKKILWKAIDILTPMTSISLASELIQRFRNIINSDFSGVKRMSMKLQKHV